MVTMNPWETSRKMATLFLKILLVVEKGKVAIAQVFKHTSVSWSFAIESFVSNRMHSFWARFRLRFPARSMAPSNKNHPRTTPRHAIVLHPHDIHRPGAQVSRQLWTRSKVGEPQTDITSSIESMTTSKHSFLKQPQSPPNPY